MASERGVECWRPPPLQTVQRRPGRDTPRPAHRAASESRSAAGLVVLVDRRQAANTSMPSGCARLPSCRGRKADVPVKQSATKPAGPKAPAAKPAAAKAIEAPAGAKEGNKGKAKKGGPPPAAAAFLARCCLQMLRDHEPARAASLLISCHPVRARLPCRVEHRAGKRQRRRLLPPRLSKGLGSRRRILLPPPHMQALLPAGRRVSRATTTAVMSKKRSAWLSTPLGPRRRTLQASRPAWKGC